MRPTRIVVGEVRGAEALDMLLAMNTGHDGSLTTIHALLPARRPRPAGDAGDDGRRAPLRAALKRMVARTIELVVQLRVEPRTGRRRVASVFEVTGLEGDVVAGNDLWALDPAADRLVWTGLRPRCLAKIAARGVPYALPPALPAAGVRGDVLRVRASRPWPPGAAGPGARRRGNRRVIEK